MSDEGGGMDPGELERRAAAERTRPAPSKAMVRADTIAIIPQGVGAPFRVEIRRGALVVWSGEAMTLGGRGMVGGPCEVQGLTLLVEADPTALAAKTERTR